MHWCIDVHRKTYLFVKKHVTLDTWEPFQCGTVINNNKEYKRINLLRYTEINKVRRADYAFYLSKAVDCINGKWLDNYDMFPIVRVAI